MEVLLTALALGFAAGISPGPLSTLVVTSALERGFGAGARVGIAPLLTDGPVVLLAVFALRDLPDGALALLGAVGGTYLIWLGVKTIAASRTPLDLTAVQGDTLRDLRRGVIANLLNPAPWLFWATVGGPILVGAWRQAPSLALGFLAIFYSIIVGLKMALAWIAGRGRALLQGRGYQQVLLLSGLVLMGLGGLMLWQGVDRL